MRNFLKIFLVICIYPVVWAGHASFDIFGVTGLVANHIEKQYGKKIQFLEQNRVMARAHHQDDTKLAHEILNIQQQIKEKYHFPDVQIDSVFYPDRGQIFTTLNVCTQVREQPIVQDYPQKVPLDIVDRMHFFVLKAVDFMVMHPEYSNKLDCKDDHCISPEHAYFKPDLERFRRDVPKQWLMIQKTLNHDPILERRRAAIFLLPYLQSIDLESKVLLHLLDDKSYLIRHDALRVYGEVLAKHPDMQVSIERVARSLSACDEAERNKTLILLQELAKQERYHKALIYYCGKKLMPLLELSQPNNHEFAYHILQKISHHDYSEWDFLAWKTWLDQQLALIKV